MLPEYLNQIVSKGVIIVNDKYLWTSDFHFVVRSEDKMHDKNTIKELMNRWGSEGIPFLFIIDFEQHKPLIYKLDEIDAGKLLYFVNGLTNSAEKVSEPGAVILEKHPEPFSRYLSKFNKVLDEISLGNTYLLNLTCSTPVDVNASLRDIFLNSKARYKLWYNDQFVCFSPEIFITVKEGMISSFPMKGTIDASVPDAAKIIINDHKETAEHNTIVDLIRNDLNTVARNVRVERFRYVETVRTQEKQLLQVSSEIRGELEEGYPSKIGDIIFSLLPAGSVSGAPKKKTIEIILQTEGEARGFYTGIFGIFDGRDLDSGVLIRFIEKTEKGYIYHSGGGITSFSNPRSEYQEMTDKIYVPPA